MSTGFRPSRAQEPGTAYGPNRWRRKRIADRDHLHRLADWTDGCIAVTNGEVEEIWGAVADGIPIDIRP